VLGGYSLTEGGTVRLPPPCGDSGTPRRVPTGPDGGGSTAPARQDPKRACSPAPRESEPGKSPAVRVYALGGSVGPRHTRKRDSPARCMVSATCRAGIIRPHTAPPSQSAHPASPRALHDAGPAAHVDRALVVGRPVLPPREGAVAQRPGALTPRLVRPVATPAASPSAAPACPATVPELVAHRRTASSISCPRSSLGRPPG